jgi:hypothetical protein
MQPIAHLLLSIVAGLGVGLHLDNRRQKAFIIIFLAIITCAIDIDHLLPGYNETGIAIFHNVFVFILIPAFLYFTFFILERQKSTSLKQRSCLILVVMFLGAMFTDGITDSGMPLFYPIRSEMFGFINMETTLDATLFSLSSAHVILIIWGIAIAGANLLESLIYNDVEGQNIQSPQSKVGKTASKRKSWLPVIIGGFPLIGFSSSNDLKMNEKK